MKGSDLLLRCLENEGVQWIFGVPGIGACACCHGRERGMMVPDHGVGRRPGG